MEERQMLKYLVPGAVVIFKGDWADPGHHKAVVAHAAPGPGLVYAYDERNKASNRNLDGRRWNTLLPMERIIDVMPEGDVLAWLDREPVRLDA